MRCNVGRHILPLIISALLGMDLAAQQAQPDANRPKPTPVTQITLAGKHIKGHDVLVRKGTAYVSVPALAEALGASVSSKGQVTAVSIPAPPEVECVDVPAAWKLSDAYRKAAVRIPDAIESFRTVVNKATMNKHVAAIPAASFDDVEHQISEADFRARTEADKSVSYALFRANNTLAIMYYKLWRGVPSEYARQEQLESVLCSMESKFALQVGRLSGKENCRVFHFHQEEANAKPADSN